MAARITVVMAPDAAARCKRRLKEKDLNRVLERFAGLEAWSRNTAKSHSGVAERAEECLLAVGALVDANVSALRAQQRAETAKSGRTSETAGVFPWEMSQELLRHKLWTWLATRVKSATPVSLRRLHDEIVQARKAGGAN